jgi:hypothetical protein
MYGVTMSILSRFPTPHHQAQQNFNKLLGACLTYGIEAKNELGEGRFCELSPYGEMPAYPVSRFSSE